MYRALKLAVCACAVFAPLGATTVVSQNQVVALYGDLIPSDCQSWTRSGGAYAGFYVFHYSASGATGSRFRLPEPPPTCLGECEGPIFLQSPYSRTGSLWAGITFEYGVCLTGWILVAEVFYLDPSGFGLPWCCEQHVLAHPEASSGQVEARDCGGIWRVAEGVSGIIGGDPTCPCSPPTGIEDVSTTWGTVKACFTE